MRDKYNIRHFYARQNTGLLDSKRNYIKINLSRPPCRIRHPRKSLSRLDKIFSSVETREFVIHSSNERSLHLHPTHNFRAVWWKRSRSSEKRVNLASVPFYIVLSVICFYA